MTTYMKLNMIPIQIWRILQDVEKILDTTSEHQNQMYALQQSMCCSTYLVQVYVESDMSWPVKFIFKDIWNLTSIVIEGRSHMFLQIDHVVKE